MTQATQAPQRGIQMTETALKQVMALREQQGEDLFLRVGVRQGGCSGMSYTMDFEDGSNVREDDEVYDYDGFQVVCDRKSLLYLYGLVLDYNTALIGGGFTFTNQLTPLKPVAVGVPSPPSFPIGGRLLSISRILGGGVLMNVPLFMAGSPVCYP